MSNNIVTYFIKDIGKISMCKRVLKGETVEVGEIPFYKISTFGKQADTFISKKLFEEYRNKFSFPKSGDILISAAGTIGKTVIYNGEDGYFQDSNIVWVDNDETKVINQYLYYFFQTKPWLTTNGSTITRIYNENLRSIKLNAPIDLSYQKAITSVLSILDSKIELNNKINAELEAMAKTIYDYWFVQFDFPISKEQAKDMGNPKLEGKPYKSSGGKMVWNEVLKREIPENWEVGPIGDWISVNKSGDWGKEVKDGNYQKEVSCIRGTDINGVNGQEQCNPPTRYILEKNGNKILEPGDLIVEISGGSPTQSTGRLALISEEILFRFENPIICSNFCKPITIKNKKYLYNFAYYWNNLYMNGIFFSYEGKTSGIKNFLFDSFVSSYLTTKPDEKIVSKFYDLISPIQAKKQTALKENQELVSLRDWLLPMLMNGQVKVGDGERMVKQRTQKIK